MEPTDTLFDQNAPNDFIHLIENGYSKETFQYLAERQLGKDWPKAGRQIVKNLKPSIIGDFQRYCD